MLQIFVNPRYDFIGKRRWAYLLSAAVTVAGLLHIAYKGGLQYGIDFAGGTLVQVRFEQATTVDGVRHALDRVRLGESVIQQFGDPQEYLIRVPAGSGGLEEVSKRVEAGLREAGLPKFEVRRLEFVGPQVGKDLQWQAIYAVLAGMAGILIYTAIRFDFKGGVAAILALIHDVLVALAGISLTNREMSLPVLAALLTIVGYSINDTIVVYDRIREYRGRGVRKGETLADVINLAINQTLSRTILTSLTVFLVVAVLYAFGGEVLRDFAFALLVGVVTGTYSSIFVAAPIIVDWEGWSQARQRRVKKAVAKAGAGR
ncbi:MAG TPA: protein translocase subunit SecF [Methylomirabilota bacterium]|jgi:preprotein translocase SecF subunit|nr:protein translocase subunit SecF [Methylomirabilota bacterium]